MSAAPAAADEADLDNTGVRFSGPSAELMSPQALANWNEKSAAINAEAGALRREESNTAGRAK